MSTIWYSFPLLWFEAVLRLHCFYFAQKQHFICLPCLFHVFIALCVTFDAHFAHLQSTYKTYRRCMHQKQFFLFIRSVEISSRTTYFLACTIKCTAEYGHRGPNNCMVNNKIQPFSVKALKVYSKMCWTQNEKVSEYDFNISNMFIN